MDLFSEDRDRPRTLNYTLTRERGQKNQQRINNTHAHSTGNRHLFHTREKLHKKLDILPTQVTNKIQGCWNCGYQFIKGHLENCPV